MQDSKKCRKTRIGIITFLTPEFPIADVHLNSVREAIEECLGNGEFKIVLDCKQVPFLDSSGLEVLVNAQNHLQKKGGDLKIAHPNAVCHDTLIATRLTDRFEIYTEMENAGRSFS